MGDENAEFRVLPSSDRRIVRDGSFSFFVWRTCPPHGQMNIGIEPREARLSAATLIKSGWLGRHGMGEDKRKRVAHDAGRVAGG